MRGATTSNLEMCICKLHLHARWAIHALIKCAKQQQINLDFNCYNEFFSHLTRNCVASDTTIIDWECVPCKKESCEHITSKWRQLFDDISTQEDKDVTVKLMHFEKVLFINKYSKTTYHLKSTSTEANLSFILMFIDKMLSKIIFHRNYLIIFAIVV